MGTIRNHELEVKPILEWTAFQQNRIVSF